MSPLWMGVWLALFLIGAKSGALDPRHLERWVFDLPIVSFGDVLFALGLGVLGEVGVRFFRGRVSVERRIRRAVLGICLLCALYSVVATGVFNYFGRHLTFDLLKLVRSAAAIESSISSQLTLPIAIALIGVPFGYIATAHWAARREGVPVLAICLFSVWTGVGTWQYVKRPKEWNLRQLSKNPHVELLRSTWTGMLGREKPALPTDFPPEYKEEFRPMGERARGSAGFQSAAGVTPPRNVIVIVLESVATRYLSLYGSRYGATPGLLAEAENAAVFDNFYAHVPYTFCSFMALNFSVYPGLPWCYVPGTSMGPDSTRPYPTTLASILQKRGVRTAYLHNGDMEWGGMKEVLAGQGYDLIEDYRGMDAPMLTSWGVEDRFLIDRLIGWVDEKPGQPFYAFCWTDQTHDPYQLPPRARKKDFFNGKSPERHGNELSRYLNVLHQTDRHLKRLFDALRQRGLADDTLVVITGDHGEAFSDPHDQRGHGFTIYQEDLNVPLILWNPRLFPKGQRVKDAVGAHVDLNPTLADLLGIEPPDDWQGYSLFDPERPQRAMLQANIGEYLFGIRDGRWKYTFAATSGEEMLFDIDQDPEEQENVAAHQSEVVKELRNRVAAWIAFEDEFLRPSPAK